MIVSYTLLSTPSFQQSPYFGIGDNVYNALKKGVDLPNLKLPPDIDPKSLKAKVAKAYLQQVMDFSAGVKGVEEPGYRTTLKKFPGVNNPKTVANTVKRIMKHNNLWAPPAKK